MKYPKIETLFNRDKETFKVIEGDIRLLEFSNIIWWYVTEKIDGTNIRIIYNSDVNRVDIKGRTDKAQTPKFLQQYLEHLFTPERLELAFQEPEGEIILYGEGYGARIQKGGGNYRPDDVSFRLFDVKIGNWWLEPHSIDEIADKLGILAVPFLGIWEKYQIVEYVKSKPKSCVAYQDSGQDYKMEGIVARSHPLVLRRNRRRVIFKLKVNDFA